MGQKNSSLLKKICLFIPTPNGQVSVKQDHYALAYGGTVSILPCVEYLNGKLQTRKYIQLERVKKTLRLSVDMEYDHVFSYVQHCHNKLIRLPSYFRQGLWLFFTVIIFFMVY